MSYAKQNLIYLTRCARSPKQATASFARYWKPWEDRFLLAYQEVNEHRLADILNRSPIAIQARIRLHKNRPEDTLA